MERFICVHGHFYQPPRENPWLEAIEVQDSAYPFHDWNERIADECYGPNGTSRILDGEGKILEILNNYALISYNFGPTLLAWLEWATPDIYQGILDADKLSAERFGGHGSAMAQAYGHMIMPLANSRDKRTQVIWGIADFEHRFGRQPEGMWLPETAVDTETLELMAEYGVSFTVLAPHQAGSFRESGEEEWADANGGRIDPTRPYRVPLPSGNSIDIFFYDGPISQAVAFENLLERGELLAERLGGAFFDERDWPQIVHIASDGETYGHHRRHGEMALSYALRYIEEQELATLINYGQYLERFPPEYEAQIVEDTSWSCVHGIERWRANCGCNTGMNPNWNQEWRKPLRESLDWLRDVLMPLYEREGAEYLRDPWAARDDYISVILDRSPENVDAFLERNATRELNEEERIRVLKLLELQRHALLMYTSCGWFFDELSGIETVQVIQYAGRTVQLAEELFEQQFEEEFLNRLSAARSNIPQNGDGRRVYDKFVRPAMVDLPKVGAHFAMQSLFTDNGPPEEVYIYNANVLQFHRHIAGRAQLAVGQVDMRSRITGENGVLSFGVLHLGDHNLDGGVRNFMGDDVYLEMRDELTEAFNRADMPETIRLIDSHFDNHSYSLASLFRDEQRRITGVILDATVLEAEGMYEHVYEDNAPLMRFLDNIGVPLPRALRTAAEFVMGVDIERELSKLDIDLDYVRDYFEETRTWGLELDIAGMSFTLNRTLNRLAERIDAGSLDAELLRWITAIIELANDLPFDVDLWTAQNYFYAVLTDGYQSVKERAEAGDEAARAWVEAFGILGEALHVRVD